MTKPARLSRSLLGTYRPGVPCAVASGFPLGLRAMPQGSVEVVSSAPTLRTLAGPGVAILQIRGAMVQRAQDFGCGCGMAEDYESIAARFTAACGDPGAGSIVIDADTPGGEVPGLEEGIEMMLSAKAASGKRVVGYVGALCASGGVWLLAAMCDVIHVHLSARMGSIGVIIGHETDARHAEREGFDRTLVRSPPGKANPNQDELLDDLGRARLQELVAETELRFFASVAKSRGLDVAKIASWNGGMFTGLAIVAAGLADATGCLETAIALAGAFAGAQEAA